MQLDWLVEFYTVLIAVMGIILFFIQRHQNYNDLATLGRNIRFDIVAAVNAQTRVGTQGQVTVNSEDKIISQHQRQIIEDHIPITDSVDVKVTKKSDLLKKEEPTVITSPSNVDPEIHLQTDKVTPPTENNTSEVSISIHGFSNLIEYKITGGQLLSITPDVDANSLIIIIDATSDGSFTLTIPRSIVDALLETGEDDEFFVLIDGVEVDFSEDASSTDRIATIPFQAGAKEIEIIGTKLSNNKKSISQEPSIVVTTDKTSYSEGETIVITGKVRDVYSGTPVSVIVKAPNGNLVSIAQTKIRYDKKFKDELTAGGSLMLSGRTYVVVAQYGSSLIIAETSFKFN